MNKILKRVLCAPLCYLLGIHLEGHTGIGMWSDAAKCTICGQDRYDLIVLRDVETGWKCPNEYSWFAWAVFQILLPIIGAVVVTAIYQVYRPR